MRERVTFFHGPETPVDPAVLTITDTTLKGPDIEAAREDRITLALDELPPELRRVFTEAHEIHIRWAGPAPYEPVSPLFSRVSPGLHLFYTPQARAGHDS